MKQGQLFSQKKVRDNFSGERIFSPFQSAEGWFLGLSRDYGFQRSIWDSLLSSNVSFYAGAETAEGVF